MFCGYNQNLGCLYNVRMDIGESRYCAEIPECGKSGMKTKITYSHKIIANDLDFVPDNESFNCACEIDEIPKVFPKHYRVKSASFSDTPSASSISQRNASCPPTGFFQKVMENAKSILNMKCSNIHPASPINEEPTKDSCECESDSKPGQSTNSTSKGIEFASLPMRSLSYDCICDEESTKNDTSVDSYSCSVSCSCKNSSDQQKEHSSCSCQTHTMDSNINQNNTYRIVESSTKSECNSYKVGTIKSDYKPKSFNSKTCSCTINPNNTHSVNNRSRHSCCCATSKAALSDKVVQSKVDNYDASCGCVVKMHSTGTKNYPIDNSYNEVTQNSSIDQPTPEIVMVKCPNILSDKNIGSKNPSKRSVACVNSELVENKQLKQTFVNTKQIEMTNAIVEMEKPVNLIKSSTAPNVTFGKQIEKRKSVCNIDTCPVLANKLRSKSSVRDQNDQCAFVGSPILKAANFSSGKS